MPVLPSFDETGVVSLLQTPDGNRHNSHFFCLFIAQLIKESIHTEVKTRFYCQHFNYRWLDKRKMTLTND